MRASLKLLDYIFVLRPTLFYPVWTVALAGHWAQARTTPALQGGAVSEILIALYLVGLTLVLGASFLINQTMDIQSDQLNNKLYLIANGDISLRAAYLETALLCAVPILAMLFFRRDLALLLAAAFLITGWAYSLPPLSLKDRPIGGGLTNFLGGLAIFSYGWCLQAGWSLSMLLHSLPYLLAILAVYFLTTIPDRHGDAAAAKITAAVRWGMPKTILAGFIAELSAVATAVWMRDPVILTASLLALPFFIRTVVKQDERSVQETCKYSILFLSLIMCIRFPAYLFFIVLVFFVSKWYYRVRFAVNYPSLRT
ncbi:UbiA family prenyltransferase [bacterium]|nr:UbiA family prenyltransferase [bacterium]